MAESSSKLIFPGSTRQVRASDIAYSPASGLVATEVQSAIDELQQNQVISQIDILALQGLAALLDPWQSTFTYSINELVAYNGQIYKSLQDNNLNNNPILSPTFWYRILRGDELDGIIVDLDGIASGQVLYFDGININYKSINKISNGETGDAESYVETSDDVDIKASSFTLGVDYTSSGTDQNLTSPSGQYSTPNNFVPGMGPGVFFVINQHGWSKDSLTTGSWSSLYTGSNYGQIIFHPFDGAWNSFNTEVNGIKTFVCPRLANGDSLGGYVSYYYHQTAWTYAFNGTEIDAIIAQDGSVYKGSISLANLVVTGSGHVGVAGGGTNPANGVINLKGAADTARLDNTPSGSEDTAIANVEYVKDTASGIVSNLENQIETNIYTINQKANDYKTGPLPALTFSNVVYQDIDFVNSESEEIISTKEAENASGMVLRFKHQNRELLEDFISGLTDITVFGPVTPDLVTNGGMESGDPPSSWTAANSAVLSRSTDSYAGFYSLAVGQATAGTNVVHAYQTVYSSLPPELNGRRVVLSFAIKNVSGTGDLQATIDDGIDITQINISPSSNFVIKSLSRVIEISATKLEIKFGSSGGLNSFIVDDVKLFAEDSLSLAPSDVYDFTEHKSKVVDLSSLNWSGDPDLKVDITPGSTLSDVEVSLWTNPVASASIAEEIAYDNSSSGLMATDVQEAIDELTDQITSSTGIYTTVLDLDENYEQLVTHNFDTGLLMCYALVDGGVDADYYISPHIEYVTDNTTKVVFDKDYNGTLFMYSVQKRILVVQDFDFGSF